jgi:hypothetical protein
MLHVITNTQDTIAGFILQGLADKNENRIIEFPRGRRTPWQKIIRHIESLQKKNIKKPLSHAGFPETNRIHKKRRYRPIFRY